MALATLRVRTAHLPDLEVDPEQAVQGETSWVWRFLKPSLTVETPLGSYSKAPWGDPGESSWPTGAALLVLAIGGIALLIFAAGRRSA